MRASAARVFVITGVVCIAGTACGGRTPLERLAGSDGTGGTDSANTASGGSNSTQASGGTNAGNAANGGASTGGSGPPGCGPQCSGTCESNHCVVALAANRANVG